MRAPNLVSKIERPRRLTAVRFIALVLSALTSVPIAHGAPSSEWVMKQNLAGGGPQTIYLSENAVRVVNDMNGHEILCKAPLWTVYWYRPADKVVHSSSLEEAFRIYNFSPALCEARAANYKQLGDGRIDGVVVRKYGDSADGIWLAKDMNVSPKASQLLMACYGLKLGSGVVIRSWYPNRLKSRVNARADQWGTAVDIEGDVIKYLTTQSIKQVPFSANDFRVPTNFKTVPWKDIFHSKTQTKAWESLLDDMKVGEKFDSTKK